MVARYHAGDGRSLLHWTADPHLDLLAGASWGWLAMLISSIMILWYLPIGTVTAILTIVILLLPWTRP